MYLPKEKREIALFSELICNRIRIRSGELQWPDFFFFIDSAAVVFGKMTAEAVCSSEINQI